MEKDDFKKMSQYYFRNLFNFKGQLPFHLYKKLNFIPNICGLIMLVIFFILLLLDVFTGYPYNDLSYEESIRQQGIDHFKTMSFIVFIFLFLYLSTLSTEIKRFRFLWKSPVVYLALGFIGLTLIYAFSYYSNVIMHSTSNIGVLLIILIPWFANNKNKPTDRDALYKDYDFEDVERIE